MTTQQVPSLGNSTPTQSLTTTTQQVPPSANPPSSQNLTTTQQVSPSTNQPSTQNLITATQQVSSLGNPTTSQNVTATTQHAVHQHAFRGGIPSGMTTTPSPRAPGSAFWLKHLTNHIKKCAGCGGPFVQQACSGVCVAANDVFTLTFSSGRTIAKESTVHFHPFQSCLLRKFPHIHSSDIACKITLTLEQKNLLIRSLGRQF